MNERLAQGDSDHLSEGGVNLYSLCYKGSAQPIGYHDSNDSLTTSYESEKVQGIYLKRLLMKVAI